MELRVVDLDGNFLARLFVQPKGDGGISSLTDLLSHLGANKNSCMLAPEP